MDEFLNIMDRLLAEDGCPWDRVQTHESLRQYLIEESYEVLDAIDKKDDEGLCEELGDVLLQVVFHSKLAEKEGKFTFDDVVRGVSEKMITRHPHIFGKGKADTSEEVLNNWEEIKKKEKGYKSSEEVLESVPKAMPALMRAEKLVSKSCGMSGDKPDPKALSAELKTLADSLLTADPKDKETVSDIIGRILMDAVKNSYIFKINPEFALTNESEKIITNSRRLKE